MVRVYGSQWGHIAGPFLRRRRPPVTRPRRRSRLLGRSAPCYSNFHAFPSTSRPLAGRTVLQIVPDLQSGGAERATIDIAEALHEAGARALVASRGRPHGQRAAGQGRRVATLPGRDQESACDGAELACASPASCATRRSTSSMRARGRRAWVAYYAARQSRRALRHHLSQRLWRLLADQAALQFDHGGGRSRDRQSRNSPRAHSPRSIREAAARVVVIARGVDLRAFSPAAVEPARVERVRAPWGVARA